MNKESIKMLLIIVFILSVGAGLFFKSGSNEQKLSGNEIKRNPPGKGNRSESFVAIIDDIAIDELEVGVKERKYTATECEEIFLEYQDVIIEKMLGENKNLEMVNSDLCFFSQMEGCPFEFFFFTDSREKVASDGTIYSIEDFDTKITILITYDDFLKNFTVSAHVVPGQSIKARVYENNLLTMLENSQDVTEETITLPREIMGKEISYMLPASKRNPVYLLLSITASVAVMVATRRDKRKREKEKKKELMKEYPSLLQKMALYQATGMTIRNIWVRIYEEGKEKKGDNHPLYQEMGRSINELQSGISEGMVYKRFGERTQIPQMVRFTALLSQNLKKGSSKLKELLDDETDKAYIERKQRAIREGEEAGTKLLFPMMILLLDVLIIIMVPAFMSM